MSQAGPTVAMIFVRRMYNRLIMGQIVPDAIEQYLASLNHQADAVLQDIARVGDERDLPLVDAEVGVLLRVLATAVQAKRILEIGTAIGYSGIWLAGRAAGGRDAADDGDGRGAGARRATISRAPASPIASASSSATRSGCWRKCPGRSI